MAELFLYTVYPRRPIVVEGAGTIRVPKSVQLTKEDVFNVLKVATVYRRFPGLPEAIRVTVDTVDRYHRKEYLSDEEWAKVSEGVVAEKPAEKVEEPVKVVEEEKPVEEVVTEAAEVTESEEVSVEEAEEEAAEEESEKEVDVDDEYTEACDEDSEDVKEEEEE